MWTLIIGIIIALCIIGFIYLVTENRNVPYSTQEETIQNNKKGLEGFSDSFFKHPKHCPALLGKLQDKDTYDRLKPKMNTVVNDGSSFMGFHNGKKIDSDSEYCYINTFDHTKSEKKMPCSKEEDVYDFSMIKDVSTGTVHEVGDSYPKDVCIMEIDDKKATELDVLEMESYIDRHDNAHLIKSIDDYKDQLSRFVKKSYKLQSENEEIANNLKMASASQEACAQEKKQLLLDKVLLESEVTSMKNNVIVLGDDFTDYNDSQRTLPRLELNVNSGNKEIDIPNNFTINYIFIPKNRTVRLMRKNGSYSDFSHDSVGYPNVQEVDTFNVTKVILRDS